MPQPLLRPMHALRLRHVAFPNRSVATAANQHHPHHPNPANFANRSKEELSAIGHRGGKKGGKARGVGGFHDMDPEKQVGFIHLNEVINGNSAQLTCPNNSMPLLPKVVELSERQL